MRADKSDKQARKANPLKRLDFWIAAVGIGSLVVTIVTLVIALREPEASVTIETISDTNVLDLRRPLQDLSIVFRGQNVQEQNLNLRIVTINVVNSGEVDILPNQYDSEDDWGVQFKDGEVIEARLVDTSSDYLQSKVIPERSSVDTVVFPKIILEQGAFFAVEVLLLHSKNELPSISSVGKIAGVDEITVLTRPLSREEVSFATELFRGSALIQAVRVIIYLVGSLIAIIVAILALFAVTTVFSNLNSRKRRSRILQTRVIHQVDQDELRDLLVSHYESSGITGLKELQELLREPTRLNWVSPQGWWAIRGHHHVGDWARSNPALDMEFVRLRSQSTLDALMRVGVLKRNDDNSPHIDQEFCKVVDNLVAALEE